MVEVVVVVDPGQVMEAVDFGTFLEGQMDRQLLWVGVCLAVSKRVNFSLFSSVFMYCKLITGNF